MPPTAASSRPTTATSRPTQATPSDAAVRIVSNALRTLVPEAGVITLSDLTAVTRLDPDEACAATNRLTRTGPLSVSRYAAEGPPAWHVRRTDR